MKRGLITGSLAIGLALGSAVAFSAGIPLLQGPLDPGGTLNTLNGLVRSINANVPGYSDAAPGRNYISNGAMNVAQRGAGILTCGDNTAPTVTGFGADRWACDVNVASGAGRTKVVATGPTPPTGFSSSLQLYRTSGGLLQPVCSMQAIETTRSVQLQGKSIIVSAYLQPLAAMQGPVSFTVITGTGADEGFGTLTASPAITPAWTGLASTALTAGTGSASFTIGTTAVWSRVWSTPILIPTTATEVGLEICFTPTAAAAGTTNGFAFTGVQLEIAGASQVTPSAYEFVSVATDLAAAQRFYWQLNEPANGAAVPAFGQATGASTTSWTFYLPQQMRGTTPTVLIPVTGTFKTNIAGTPTTWVTPTAGVCGTLACTVTGGNTNTAGQAETVTGGGGSGVVTVMNDVIM